MTNFFKWYELIENLFRGILVIDGLNSFFFSFHQGIARHVDLTVNYQFLVKRKNSSVNSDTLAVHFFGGMITRLKKSFFE